MRTRLSSLSRRKWLSVCGGLGVCVLSGCLDDDDSDARRDSRERGTDRSDSGDEDTGDGPGSTDAGGLDRLPWLYDPAHFGHEEYSVGSISSTALHDDQYAETFASGETLLSDLLNEATSLVDALEVATVEEISNVFISNWIAFVLQGLSETDLESVRTYIHEELAGDGITEETYRDYDVLDGADPDVTTAIRSDGTVLIVGEEFADRDESDRSSREILEAMIDAEAGAVDGYPDDTETGAIFDRLEGSIRMVLPAEDDVPAFGLTGTADRTTLEYQVVVDGEWETDEVAEAFPGLWIDDDREWERTVEDSITVFETAFDPGSPPWEDDTDVGAAPAAGIDISETSDGKLHVTITAIGRLDSIAIACGDGSPEDVFESEYVIEDPAVGMTFSSAEGEFYGECDETSEVFVYGEYDGNVAILANY